MKSRLIFMIQFFVNGSISKVQTSSFLSISRKDTVLFTSPATRFKNRNLPVEWRMSIVDILFGFLGCAICHQISSFHHFHQFLWCLYLEKMTGFRTGYDSNWSISDMYLENKFKWGLFMTQDSANIIKAAQFA